MKRYSGFTLVELLIASAIFLVVVTTIYSAFYTGAFGYYDIERAIDISQTARQVLERINLDLRNSLKYSQDNSRFTGEAHAISFYALVDRFYEDRITQDYSFISYKLEDTRLMRLCLENKETLTDEPKGEDLEMDANIEELSFSYGFIPEGQVQVVRGEDAWDDLKWEDAWDDPKTLPIAIKVKLTIKNKIEQDFERTIFLPSA